MLRANFYPRPPRGGRRRNAAHSRKQLRISIHALREEGDGLGVWDYSNQPDFYPRPPRGGRRGYNFRIKVKRDFYPRPPRGGRRACGRVCFRVCTISIHALREEGDTSPADAKGAGKIFLSTPSARRATPKRSPFWWCWKDFYPRPPRGGRQQKQRQNLYFLINYTTFCTNLEEP